MMNGGEVSIGTHDGKFHADEVVGCFLLRQLREFKNAGIVRTRDPEKLKKCDVVIDVGGVFDHYQKRYDHHQKDFNETLKSVNGMDERIKLSSAGLVFAHYGKDVINEMTHSQLTLEEIYHVYRQIYNNFIKEIDARDNGIDAADPPFRYRIHTDLASRIERLNANVYSDPTFNEDIQFMKAYEMAGKEFREQLDYITKMWLPGRGVVSEALDNRYNVHESRKIVMITKSNTCWSSHLKLLENEKKIYPEIQFVVFPDMKNGWRVQAVPSDGGFGLRHKVLPKYVGLRDADLATESKIEDATFVHNTGFIGGAKTREGALQMAIKSLCDESCTENKN